MQKLHNLLKDKTGATNIEMVILFCIVVGVICIGLLSKPSALKNETSDNSSNIAQTISN